VTSTVTFTAMPIAAVVAARRVGHTRGMRFLVLAVALLAACGDSEPALSDATSLSCPTPGALPFRLTTRGFQNSANVALANDDPRNKDEASDTLGNPGGLVAATHFADDQRPVMAAVGYRGVKARTTPTGGLLSSPFAGESVSLWHYDQATMEWQSLGRGTTAADGVYELAGTTSPVPNGEPVYAMLEADGSCAEHVNTLLAPGARVIITDIDATLTTEDPELFKQVGDATYVPLMMPGADRLLQAWAAKGYPIIYLTARPHVLRVETRVWLADLGFPPGSLITSKVIQSDAGPYKAVWTKRMIEDFGWNAVAVYGNAETDISAYAAAGIPKERTFIIGPLAGAQLTVAIENNDYSQHIATFVAAQPDNL
jgi:LNS2 (Lipin/Ned1/Smp2)